MDRAYPLFWARKGGLRALVLSILRGKPMSGMDVIREIERLSLGYWRPSPGTIYPVLRLLEEEGLIKREEGGGRKVYRLTEEGERVARLYAGLLPARDVDDVITQMESYVDYLQDYVREEGILPEDLRGRLKQILERLRRVLEVK